MGYIRPQGMFDAMSQAYAARDFDGVAQFYAFPGAFYIGDDIVVWQGAEALLTFLKLHCACNYDLGVRSVAPRVVAESMAQGRHLSVWVSWVHRDHAGRSLFETQVRYFLGRSETGDLHIQIAELSERPQVYHRQGIPWPFHPEAEMPKLRRLL